MNTDTPNPNSINNPLRCQHTTLTGRRCRQRVPNPDTPLCWRHSRPAGPPKDAPDLAALSFKLRKFRSAAQVHEFLSSVLVSLAQKRVTPRQAAVFAYLCNMLLRTLSSIQLEEQAANNAPLRVDWSGIPRPDRSEPSSPLDSSDTMRAIRNFLPESTLERK